MVLSKLVWILFPMVTTPWWVWGLVIAAMLAVLAFSILLRPGSEASQPQKIDMEQKDPAAEAAPEMALAQGSAEVQAGGVTLLLPDVDDDLPDLDLPAHPDDLALGADQDDLRRIDGINPGTAAVLHAAGLTTFTVLANTPVDRLEQILRTAGMRKIDPTSWPVQARLAAESDWVALHHLQEQLRGIKP